MTNNKRRWRLWACFLGQHREQKGMEEIKRLEEQGFKAKRWMPLPQHRTSGHFHIVVLCTFKELCSLAGIEIKKV